MKNKSRALNKGGTFQVAFILHSAFTEGAEMAMINGIDHLLERDASVLVVLPFKGPLENYLKQIGVDYIFCDNRFATESNEAANFDTLEAIYNNSLKLSEYLEKISPDVIVSSSSVIMEGAFAAKILGIPHVWTISEYGVREHGINFILSEKKRLNILRHYSEKIFFVSNALADYYRSKIDPVSSYVFPPITIEQIEGLKKTKSKENYFKSKGLKLALVGNIHEGKGQKDAVLAIAEMVNKKNIDIELVLVGPVGNQGYLCEIKNIIAEENIEKNVHIFPASNNVSEVFEQSDIVLMCSVFEAFGRVTAEAMYFRKPVIGARSGGTPELIKDGVNGFLYEAGNYRELSEKLLFFINNKAEIMRFGDAGFKMITEKINDKEISSRYYTEISKLKRKGRKKNKADKIKRRIRRDLGFRDGWLIYGLAKKVKNIIVRLSKRILGNY